MCKQTNLKTKNITFGITVPCPAGTMHSQIAKQCIPCPPGLYQPNMNQTQCLPCPGGTTSSHRGATRCQGEYYFKSLLVFSGGSKGARGTRALGGPNSFNFMQFLGKFGKIICWRPSWGVGAPSSGKSWIRQWSLSSKAVFSLFAKVTFRQNVFGRQYTN